MKKPVTLDVEAREWSALKAISKRTGRSLRHYVAAGIRAQIIIGRAEVAQLEASERDSLNGDTGVGTAAMAVAA